MSRYERTQRGATLLDHVRPQEGDGELLGVVFSTYGLSLDSPNFFEQDLLPALLGLGGVHDRGYSVPVMLERRLADLESCLLLCDAHALADGARPSLRVDVHALSGRTHHAKVTLLRWKRRVRLILGSANLTHDGYRLQREVAVVLDFAPEGGLPASVLREAAASWREALGSQAPPSLARELDAALAQVSTWERSARSQPSPSVRVLFGGGQVPLWQALADAWPEGEPLHAWYVCSPFWPASSNGQTPFEAITGRLQMERRAQVDDATLHVFTSASAPGERALPCFPFPLLRQLREQGFPIRRGRIVPVRLEALASEVPERRAATDHRRLHAKWQILQGPETALVLLGSANFTRRGLGLERRPSGAAANVEACILLRLPAKAFRPEEWLPPIVPSGTVDWATVEAKHVAPIPEEEQDAVVWPTFLNDVQLHVAWHEGPEPSGMLCLHLQAGPVPGFAVSFDTENVPPREPFHASTARELQGPAVEEVRLSPAEVRRLLVQRTVRLQWEKQSVRYPLNIAEESRTGLPSVLGARPTEMDLLDYFHGRLSADDLMLMMQSRAQQEAAGRQDSPEEAARLLALQSYLVREFVESLFGLADVLREATRSPRAFEHALVGEYSPLGLAEQVLQAFVAGRRSPTATAFQLSELLRLVATLSLEQTDDAERLEVIRRRALERLLGLVQQCAQRQDFIEQCTHRAFRQYLRATLPEAVARNWEKALSIGAEQQLAPKREAGT